MIIAHENSNIQLCIGYILDKKNHLLKILEEIIMDFLMCEKLGFY